MHYTNYRVLNTIKTDPISLRSGVLFLDMLVKPEILFHFKGK